MDQLSRQASWAGVQASLTMWVCERVWLKGVKCFHCEDCFSSFVLYGGAHEPYHAAPSILYLLCTVSFLLLSGWFSPKEKNSFLCMQKGEIRSFPLPRRIQGRSMEIWGRHRQQRYHLHTSKERVLQESNKIPKHKLEREKKIHA